MSKTIMSALDLYNLLQNTKNLNLIVYPTFDDSMINAECKNEIYKLIYTLQSYSNKNEISPNKNVVFSNKNYVYNSIFNLYLLVLELKNVSRFFSQYPSLTLIPLNQKICDLNIEHNESVFTIKIYRC